MRPFKAQSSRADAHGVISIVAPEGDRPPKPLHEGYGHISIPREMSGEVTHPQAQQLLGWERAGLWFLLLLVLVFGGIVEMRSAFMQSRKTDADCYFRAAWAVRTGQDIYSVVETNGWHYNYPPLLAILMVPLANPPPDVSNAGYLPYPVSVAVWYLFSVGCFVLAVHWLASAIGKKWRVPAARWSRQWWGLRSGTMIICLMALGRTLSRGQVNTLVLLCFAGMIALLLAERRFLAGLCLALPVCIKLFPAFLLIVPVIRRDWRCLAGAVCGLVMGLMVVPLAVLGPQRMAETYKRFNEVLIGPALGLKSDAMRDEELTGATATDSQSFAALLHNIPNPNPFTRPKTFAPWVRQTHWALGALFTLATLAAGFYARRRDAIGAVLFIGLLIVVMLPVSPVCHIHYFIFAMPLVMGLLAAAWERVPFPRLPPGLNLLFATNIILNVLAALPGFERWKDFGVTLGATFLLWGAGIFELLRRQGPEPLNQPATA